MRKNKLLLLLALLLTAATGAWAQESATTYSVKMKNGTQDAKNWSIASGEKSATGDDDYNDIVIQLSAWTKKN